MQEIPQGYRFKQPVLECLVQGEDPTLSKLALESPTDLWLEYSCNLMFITSVLESPVSPEVALIHPQGLDIYMVVNIPYQKLKAMWLKVHV